MYDYAHPTLDMKPDALILHVGTNDLKIIREIVDNIINLAVHCNRKSEVPVIISSLTYRDDQYKERIDIVNKDLKEICGERNIGFVDNGNINRYHLNKSKLHLNNKGSALMAKHL